MLIMLRAIYSSASPGVVVMILWCISQFVLDSRYCVFIFISSVLKGLGEHAMDSQTR